LQRPSQCHLGRLAHAGGGGGGGRRRRQALMEEEEEEEEEEEQEQEEGLYLRIETRKRVQTNEAKGVCFPCAIIVSFI